MLVTDRNVEDLGVRFDQEDACNMYAQRLLTF